MQHAHKMSYDVINLGWDGTLLRFHQTSTVLGFPLFCSYRSKLPTETNSIQRLLINQSLLERLVYQTVP